MQPEALLDLLIRHMPQPAWLSCAVLQKPIREGCISLENRIALYYTDFSGVMTCSIHPAIFICNDKHGPEGLAGFSKIQRRGDAKGLAC